MCISDTDNILFNNIAFFFLFHSTGKRIVPLSFKNRCGYMTLQPVKCEGTRECITSWVKHLVRRLLGLRVRVLMWGWMALSSHAGRWIGGWIHSGLRMTKIRLFFWASFWGLACFRGMGKLSWLMQLLPPAASRVIFLPIRLSSRKVIDDSSFWTKYI